MQTALLAVTLSLSAVGCHHRSACVIHRSACYSACYSSCYSGCYGGGYAGQAYGGGRVGPIRRIMGNRMGSGYGASMAQYPTYGGYSAPYAGTGAVGNSYGMPATTYGMTGNSGYSMPATTSGTMAGTSYGSPGTMTSEPATVTNGVPVTGAAGTGGRTYSSAYGPNVSGSSPALPATGNPVPGVGQTVTPGASGGVMPAAPSTIPPAPPAPPVPR